MRLLLLHLSDPHFRHDKDTSALYRAPKIAQAALGNILGVNAVIALWTGDFIDKGQAKAFDFASTFLDDLANAVTSQDKRVEWLGEVLVPGNHDVVRPVGEKAIFHRKSAIDSLIRGAKTVAPDAVEVAIALEVQDEYFKFDTSRSGRAVTTPENRLSWKNRFEFKGKTIDVISINTSWMSVDDDDQGRLFAWLPDLSDSVGAAFTIALMHHPFSWLKSENMRPIYDRIVATADIVLSGHEHHGQDFVRHSEGTPETVFFEGDALVDGKPNEPKSGFSALLLDFETGQRTTHVFKWDGQRYQSSKARAPAPLRKEISGSLDGFVFTLDFAQRLDDPGFASPGNVRSRDVFVYPKLNLLSLDADSQEPHKEQVGFVPDFVTKEQAGRAIPTQKRLEQLSTIGMVDGAEVLKKLNKTPRIILVGEEESGRTALLSEYLRELRTRSYVPVLIEGRNIKKFDIESVQNLVLRAVEDQYGPESLNKYRELGMERKVLLIDDLDDVIADSTELRVLITTIEKLSSSSILTAGDLFLLRQIYAAMHDVAILSYNAYAIQPLDFKQISELTSKMYLYLHESTDEQDCDTLVRLERNLEAVIGSDTVTPYPGKVKVLLRDLISGQHNGAEHGAYGFYYNRLILNDINVALEPLEKEQAGPLSDVIQGLLTELAYRMFTAGSVQVSESDIDALIEAFRLQGHDIEKTTTLKVLIRARMIVKKDEAYLFREKYQRFFYLASKFRDLLGGEDRTGVKKYLSGLVQQLHDRDSAEVILFTVYLTKNQWLLNEVVGHAKTVLDGMPECDMDRDFDIIFTTRSKSGSSPEVAQTAEAEKEREERLSRTLRNVVQALNFIMVAGQAARTYPAKIDLDYRVELIKESYSIALRALSAFIGLLGEDQEQLERLSREYLRVQKRDIHVFQEPDQIDGLIFRLMTMVGFGVVRRLTEAVASPHLARLLESIGKNDERVSMKMIRTSVLMDIRRIPTVEVKHFFEDLKRNMVGRSILQNLVINNVRVFRAKLSRRETLCAAVEVDAKAPELFYSLDKPLTAGKR